MKRSKIILLISLVCFLLVVIVVLYMMNMPHRNVSRETPVTITATGLVETYQKDEPAANKQFLDRVLQVTGVVEGVETNNDGQTIIILSGVPVLSGVRCTLQKNATVETGKTVILKGRCTGYLSDVVLVDCLFIE